MPYCCSHIVKQFDSLSVLSYCYLKLVNGIRLFIVRLVSLIDCSQSPIFPCVCRDRSLRGFSIASATRGESKMPVGGRPPRLRS